VLAPLQGAPVLSGPDAQLLEEGRGAAYGALVHLLSSGHGQSCRALRKRKLEEEGADSEDDDSSDEEPEESDGELIMQPLQGARPGKATAAASDQHREPALGAGSSEQEDAVQSQQAEGPEVPQQATRRSHRRADGSVVPSCTCTSAGPCTRAHSAASVAPRRPSSHAHPPQGGAAHFSQQQQQQAQEVADSWALHVEPMLTDAQVATLQAAPALTWSPLQQPEWQVTPDGPWAGLTLDPGPWADALLSIRPAP
jgi:hypothetical protein